MRIAAAAAIAMSVLATSAFAGSPSFATWRGDTTLCGVARDPIPDFPAKIWEFQSGAAVSFTPVVGDGRVYFVNRDAQIFALDMKGVKVWSRGIAPAPTHPPTPPQPIDFTAPPAYAFGTLVLATAQGNVFALDGRDGREKWSASVGARVQGTPNFVDMGKDGFLVIILTQPKGVITAFDGTTGARKWVYDRSLKERRNDVRTDAVPPPPAPPPPAPPPPAPQPPAPEAPPADGAVSPPVGPDGPGSESHASGETGRPSPGRMPPRFRVDGHVSVSGNFIAYGGCDARIHVLSATNGESLLSVHLGAESEVAGGVAFAGRTVYTGCRRGTLFAVDTEEKRVKWSFGGGSAQLFTTPAASGNVVVFATEQGSVTAVDPRDPANAKWSCDIGGAHAESPVIAGERVVVVVDGKITVLDLADGKRVLWTSPSVGDKATAPAVVGGMVIVGSDSGSVTAFGLPAPVRTGDAK